MIRPQVSLRMAFWVCFGLAVGIGWAWEHYRNASELRQNIARFHCQERSDELAAEAYKRQTEVLRLEQLSDADFRMELARSNGFSELILTEMVRRQMADELRQEFARRPDSRDYDFRNDALLTALRRAEGKPEPIEITVDIVNEDPGLPGLHIPLEKPVIVANVWNRDTGRAVVWVRSGARAGDDDMWRIELTDGNGRLVLDANESRHLRAIATGMIGYTTRKYGEKLRWQSLDPRCYLRPPPSGRYQLRLLHCLDNLRDDSDPTGRIVWRSVPIWVEVENREVKPLGVLLPRFLGISLLAIGCAVFLERRPSCKKWSWRSSNLWAAGVVVLLAAGWLMDDRQQQHRIERSRPDQEANWILRKAEP
jgi:hypothetical protein